MSLKKILAIVLSMALVACISVAATVAYLTSVTATVKNTFTVGDIDITLDESKVNAPDHADAPGRKSDDGKTRVTENTYQLFPGSTYDKDPTVHVAANSEASYVFIAVVNEIADIEEDDPDANYVNIATQIIDNDWTPYTPADGKKPTGTDLANASVYYQEVSKDDDQTNLPVITGFKIDEDVVGDTLVNYKDKTVVIKAYAIQKANLSVAQAWEQVYNMTPAGDGNADFEPYIPNP